MVGRTRIGQFGVIGMVLLMTIAACGGAASGTTEAGGDQPDPTTAPVATTVPAATTTMVPAATTTMVPAASTTTSREGFIASLSPVDLDLVRLLCQDTAAGNFIAPIDWLGMIEGGNVLIPAEMRAAVEEVLAEGGLASAVVNTECAKIEFPTTVEASTGGLQIIQVGLDTSFDRPGELFQEGWVLLQNTGNTPWDLTGHYLCQRPNYFALPDVTIPAGDIYWIGVGAAIDVPGVGANGAVGSFDPGGGEVGLYSSNSFGDADAILSYVEWGSTGHGRSSVAVAAGIWSTGDFVPVLGSLTGAIIVIDAATPPGAANWEELEAP